MDQAADGGLWGASCALPCQVSRQCHHSVHPCDVASLRGDCCTASLEPLPQILNILRWLAAARKQRDEFGTLLNQVLPSHHAQGAHAAAEHVFSIRPALHSARRADHHLADVLRTLQELHRCHTCFNSIEHMLVDWHQATLLDTRKQTLHVGIVPPRLQVHHRVSSNFLVLHIRPGLSHLLVAPDAPLANLHEAASLAQER
mmetsp:Transcript_35810/g.91248  ORF Transcript_35810/g.91248 Transcript_35810/m.91248 type:complete len:201 (-) Transcript_35810:682-1284(-)